MAEAKKTVRPQWEYMVLDTQTNTFNLTKMPERFKQLGAEGWEFCDQIEVKGMGSYLVFKRPA